MSSETFAQQDALDPNRFQLYSENSSPFSASVRAAIYAKGLAIKILPPPGGLNSAIYHTINPIGTIPCLVRDDGFVLPESGAILDYLEDIFPRPALRPVDADTRARMRLLQRIGELGIMSSCIDLLQMSRASSRDEEAASGRLTRLVRSLASLGVFLSGHSFAVDDTFTLADCQLAPALAGVPAVSRVYRTGDLISAYPVVNGYFESCREHPAVQRVLDELAAAQT